MEQFPLHRKEAAKTLVQAFESRRKVLDHVDTIGSSPVNLELVQQLLDELVKVPEKFHADSWHTAGVFEVKVQIKRALSELSGDERVIHLFIGLALVRELNPTLPDSVILSLPAKYYSSLTY